MIGDRFVISAGQREVAMRILELVTRRMTVAAPPLMVSISGESGSGKSGVAYCLAGELEKKGLSCLVLAQDDYFRAPPRTNYKRRLRNRRRVGPAEVRLDLMEEHIRQLKEHPERPLVKPLVYFEEDRISSETLPAGRWDVVIVEGTYTSLLRGVDLRVFIDRDHRTTRTDRLRRARDKDPDFLEGVLDIEQRVISAHREMADLVIR